MTLTTSRHSAKAVTEGLLRRYARWLYRHPYWVVTAALLLTALSVFVSIRHLKTQTGILDLYSDDTPVNQAFLSYVKKFGAVESLILVFEGEKEADRRRAMDALAARLKPDPHHYIRDIFYRVDLQLFKDHAFQFLSEVQGLELLKQAEAPDGGIRTLFQAKTWSDFLAFINQSLETGLEKNPSPTANAGEEFQKLLQPLLLFRDFLEGQTITPSTVTTRLEESPQQRNTIDDEGYLRTDDKMMHIMFVRPSDRKQDYKIDHKLIKWVRQEITAVEKNYPGVKIGVTGGPALNNDQFQISRHDMTLASIFAYASTAVLFILAFRSFARPLLGLLTLNLAMAWVFGFTTVAIGHLNLFSLSFIVILVGQGTYYGIHVVARYEEELHRGRKVAAAIEETMVRVFGNITTSALTTAAAFYATTLVDIRGFSELGWIAGTGVVISALSMQFVLPAFLTIYDRNRSPEKLHGTREEQQSTLKPWMVQARNFLFRRAGWIVAGVTAVGLWGAFMFYSPSHGIAFDTNLLNLQAKNTEAVRYEKKLAETSLSPRAGIFMTTTIAEAERIAKAAMQVPTVQRVEWLGDVFPEGNISAATSQALRQAILKLPEDSLKTPDIPNLRTELERLKKNLEEVQNRALGYSKGEKILSASEQGIAAIDAILKKFPNPAVDSGSRSFVEDAYLAPQVQEFQSTFFGALRRMLRTAATSPPIKIKDIPPEILDRFLSSDGTYAVYAFPKGNIWERETLAAYVSELRQVSPTVTGPPVMIFEILRLVQKDYFKAALYSAAAIFLIFLLDFRSLRYAILASLPLLLGIFALFGLMSWLKLSFNTANMIALPMILGIGADIGVHSIHRFREEGERSVDFVFKSTGKAIVVTHVDSVTTFIGMAFASHQGMALLGQIVILGVISCTISGLLFLPAVMVLLMKHKKL